MKTKLQEMRKRAGYKSAREFAERNGYNIGSYTNYEQGMRELSLAKAWEFADVLGCSLDELAGRDFKPPTYSDPKQEALNGHWASLNDEGRDMLLGFAKSFASDPARRIEKAGVQRVAHQAAVGA